MLKLIRIIDRMNEMIGTGVSYLIIPLTLVMCYEIVMRYAFNAPTLWSWDISMYLGGLMIILGGAYAHLYKGHVAVEFLLEKWQPKNQVLLQLILSPLIVFPIVILLWYGWEAAWQSVKVNEHFSSLWEPPIYPLRLAIPLGALLFLLQIVSRFMSDLIRYRELSREGK
jgi:TRAP-type mannitol/chloroaromatic compound transport system permease small subunit